MRNRAKIKITGEVLARLLNLPEGTGFAGASVCVSNHTVELIVTNPDFPQPAEGADPNTISIVDAEDGWPIWRFKN